MPEDHIPWERWRRKWKNMKPGKNSKEQSVGQDKMFRRGMRSRLIDWFLLVTVIFMKLYYAKEAWGELFVGPLGAPTLREAGRPSNCSFWSRDSWKHIGFQLSSAWDAGWQPLVSSFCPRQVCSHHPHREISGVSGPVHSETSPQSGFRTGPLPPLNWWSFALKSPLLQPTAGSSSATIYETDSAYRMHQCQGWGKVFLSTWCLERARCSPPFISSLLNCGAAQTLSSSRESSLVRSVTAQAGASWGCSPGHSEHGWWSCAARGEGLCGQQTAPVGPSAAEIEWCFLECGFPCWW